MLGKTATAQVMSGEGLFFPPHSADGERKALLLSHLSFIPSRSDRRFAESLAKSAYTWSEKQAFHANKLFGIALKGKANGGPAKLPDIWGDEGEVSGPQVNAEPPSAPASATPAKSEIVEIGAEDLESAVKKVLEPGLVQIAKQVDARAEARQNTFNRVAAKEIAQQVLAQALEELEKRKPREVIVRVESTSRAIEGHKHKMLEHAAVACAANIPLLLVGPAGSGKSTGAEQIALAFALDFYIQGAASGTHEYLGYMDAYGKYHSTPFRQAFEHGGLFNATELDSGSPDVPLTLNGALAQGYMTFPDSTRPVAKHANFRIIADANTWGNGADRQYVGRTQLDAATTDRFVMLAWDYDNDLEHAIVSNRDWVDYVQAVRRAVFAEKAQVVVSPRASIYGAKLLSAGLTRDLVCDMVIWKGIDRALKDKICARVNQL